jgi:hypothetical protein
MDISLIATLIKRMGAVCLAFVILWHVAQHAGPRRGKAIVHVTRPDVAVVVDHLAYRLDSIAQSPLVCELDPGEHVARIWHGESILDEQTFTVESGNDAIVCLSDHKPAHTDIAEARPSPTAKPIRSAGLAVHSRRPKRNHAQN